MTKIITYHDNKNGVQYGEDHKLTNNWNPDADYADNEYIDVYFRIETPSYYHSGGVGFTNDTDRINFYNEIADIMKSLGWKINRYDDGKVADSQYIFTDRKDAIKQGEKMKDELLRKKKEQEKDD